MRGAEKERYCLSLRYIFHKTDSTIRFYNTIFNQAAKNAESSKLLFLCTHLASCQGNKCISCIVYLEATYFYKSILFNQGSEWHISHGLFTTQMKINIKLSSFPTSSQYVYYLLSFLRHSSFSKDWNSIARSINFLLHPTVSEFSFKHLWPAIKRFRKSFTQLNIALGRALHSGLASSVTLTHLLSLVFNLLSRLS